MSGIKVKRKLTIFESKGTLGGKGGLSALW
jgi:hypothetical protein